MGILVALIPALMWGINPLLVGKIGGKPIQQQIGTAFGATVFSAIVFAILRPNLTPALIYGSIISGALWSIGQLLQYKSYTILGNAKAFSISTAFNLILNSVVGVLLFHEWKTAGQLSLGFGALAVIIIGAVCLSYSDTKQSGDLKRGIIVLIIAAIGFTAYSCAPHYVEASGVQAVFPQSWGMIAGSLILSLFEPKNIKKFDKVTFKNMLPGLLWSIANIALIYANNMNGVAIGFTLSQAAIVVSTFISLVILHEKKSPAELKHTILGICLVMIGCIMIGFTEA